MTDELAVTLGVCAAFAAAFAYASWRAAQPTVFGKPRLLPWRTIIIVSGFCALVALVHVVNLLGFQTGRV